MHGPALSGGRGPDRRMAYATDATPMACASTWGAPSTRISSGSPSDLRRSSSIRSYQAIRASELLIRSPAMTSPMPTACCLIARMSDPSSKRPRSRMREPRTISSSFGRLQARPSQYTSLKPCLTRREEIWSGSTPFMADTSSGLTTPGRCRTSRARPRQKTVSRGSQNGWDVWMPRGAARYHDVQFPTVARRDHRSVDCPTGRPWAAR